MRARRPRVDDRGLSERERRSATLVHYLCAPAMLYTATAAAFYTWVQPIPWLVVVNVATFLGVLANELAFLRHRHVQIAQHVFAGLGVSCLVPMFLTGGVGGAGVVWYFAYLLFAYTLLGPRGGTVWATALVGITALVLLATDLAPPYPRAFLLDALWAYALSMLLAYLLNLAYDRSLAEAKRAQEQAHELDRLREMDTLKNALLSTVSHELKTPLTPLKLQTQLLQSEATGPLNEKQRKSVTIMSRNLDRLASLVQQTLDVARIQGGKLQLESKPTEIDRLLAEVVEAFEEPARGAGITLALDAAPGLRCTADPHRLTQVAFNLVSNALKFTPRGGRIVLHAAREGDVILVSVTDTGAGIAREHLGSLFLPFSRVEDAEQAKKEGTGLGLYICKGIVEQHGGRIWCESDGVGRGATFRFTLPTGTAASA